MELNDLKQFTLVMILVGFLVGGGVLALDKFGTAVYTTGSIVNESVTWNYNSTITLTNDYLLGTPTVRNSSGASVDGTAFSITAIDGTIHVGNVTTLVVNESATWSYNSTITLAFDDVMNIVVVSNSTGGLAPRSNYTFTSSAITVKNASMNGIANGAAVNITYLVQDPTLLNGASANVSYDYQQFSGASQTSINAARDAVGSVATVWLGLIITIGALAIIIVLIIRSFGGANR